MPALADFDGFALDLDGVVWLSGEPIAGSPEAINRIAGSGRRVVFVTNNPRHTRAEVVAQLAGFGVQAAVEEILTSASATAEAIAAERPGATVLTVGTESLGRELVDQGLEEVAMARGARADAVVIGGGAPFDNEILLIASEAAREGAELWATNKDPNYPTAEGLTPGTGALVAALEVASGKRARNVGKPEPEMFQAAARHLAVERPLMAGDSLDSDIAGAAGVGFATALILTGRARPEHIPGAHTPPDFVFADLAALAAEL